MVENLRQLYCEFFALHNFMHKCPQVNQTFDPKIEMISPLMVMGWLVEWSKKMYCEMLHKEIEKLFVEKEGSPKRNNLLITLRYQHNQNQPIAESWGGGEKEKEKEARQLHLSNRITVQSFFVDELHSYYKVLKLEGLDEGYPRHIKKRHEQRNLLQSKNLSQAVMVIIETSANREISCAIASYSKKYLERFPKLRSQKLLERRNTE
jgi:hypothetical protein